MFMRGERIAAVRLLFKTITVFAVAWAPGAGAAGLVEIGSSARLPWTAAVQGTDGRVIVSFPRVGPGPDPSVAVLGAGNALTPFPGGGWNSYRAGGDAGHAFVSVVAMRIGTGGTLWVLDSGVPGPGLMPVPGGTKLVMFEPGRAEAAHVWRVPAGVLRPLSALAALAVHGSAVFIADAGSPALLVLDTGSGQWRRVLDGAASTTARRPALVDGTIMRDAKGRPATVNTDTLAVSPDGAFLYFQALPGPMFRVATAALTDPAVSARALNAAVEFWYNTPSLGGAAVDAAGDLVLTDLGSDAVLRMTPDRHLSLVVRDSRLHRAGCPFVQADGGVLVPVGAVLFRVGK